MSDTKTPEQIAQELELARKASEDEKKRNDELQRKMMEISTENATLRKRQDELGRDEIVKRQQQEVAQVSSEAQEIVNDLAGDPVKAAAKLAALINKTKSESAANAVKEFLPKVENYIDKREHMNKIRMNHPEFLAYESLMKPMIEAKIKANIPLEQAIEETMNEFKPLIEKSNEVKPKPIAPVGAGGWQGANPIPSSARASVVDENSKIVYKDFSQHSRDEAIDEIKERIARQRKQHAPSVIRGG